MFSGNYIGIDILLSEVRKYPWLEGITKREAANSLIDLLGLIGAVLPLERKYETIEIVQNKGYLPKGMLYIHGINNKGNSPDNKGIVMRYASDIYNSTLHSDTAKKECAGEVVTEDNISSLYKTTGDVGETNLQDWQTSIGRAIYENSYSINGESLDVSFPSGYVEIAFDTVKTDEDGYPMIPDDKAFKQAYKYFLIKNGAEPEFYRGNVPAAIYRDIETQYDFYVGSAGNSFNMPSPDQLETMIKGLVRILPTSNNVTDGWKSFNKREVLP